MKHPYTKRKVCGKATKPKKLKQTNVSQTIKFSKKINFMHTLKKQGRTIGCKGKRVTSRPSGKEPGSA